MNEFQESLGDLLQANNLTRLQLANDLGISSTTINGYFNDGYFPKIEIAIKIAKYFNCSLDYLFALTDERQKKANFNETKLCYNLTNSLLKLIKVRKTSIAQAMRGLNMSEYNFYRWRKGKFPKTVNLIAVAKYFNASIDELIGEKM